MGESLAPPNVEPAVVAVLKAALSGVSVSTIFRESATLKGSVTVSSTGGARPVGRVVVEPTVLVECWHSEPDVASDLARKAYGALMAAVGTTVIYKDTDGVKHGMDFNYVAPTGINNNPDENRMNIRRYQFMTTIHSRLVPLGA